MKCLLEQTKNRLLDIINARDNSNDERFNAIRKVAESWVAPFIEDYSSEEILDFFRYVFPEAFRRNLRSAADIYFWFACTWPNGHKTCGFPLQPFDTYYERIDELNRIFCNLAKKADILRFDPPGEICYFINGYCNELRDCNGVRFKMIANEMILYDNVKLKFVPDKAAHFRWIGELLYNGVREGNATCVDVMARLMYESKKLCPQLFRTDFERITDDDFISRNFAHHSDYCRICEAAQELREQANVS